MHEWIRKWVTTQADWAVNWIAFLAVLMVALVAFYLTKTLVIRLVKKVITKTKGDWDNLLFESRFFRRLSHFVPGVIIGWGAIWAFEGAEEGRLIQTLSYIYLLSMGLLALNSALNVGERIYQRYPVSHKVPIKGFLQVVKILLVFGGGILMVSTVIGKSPLAILGGFGALTAVLMLVFKDPILGFVGGIQLSANDMVRTGDWIEMPQFGADGVVMDVALTTVKVQNWDKTISTIPTYSLISDSFRNWRGMEESGGRRIKRSIALDVNTIGFLTGEQLERAHRISLLRDYLKQKQEEIRAWNEESGQPNHRVNARALTNVGTFRAYIIAYLRSHPKVKQDFTLLVRQLQPTAEGLPIQVYVFVKETSWVPYEDAQSDIFDHLYAILPEFGLRAFQAPAGSDVRALGGG